MVATITTENGRSVQTFRFETSPVAGGFMWCLYSVQGDTLTKIVNGATDTVREAYERANVFVADHCC